MSDQPVPDARQIARKMVPDGLPLLDFAISDAIYSDYPDLPEGARAALVSEVLDLARRAVVTVTFPGDDDAVIQAQLLRVFADRIDRGPDIPLPPSIYSTLAREIADTLDGQADHG